MLVKYETVRRVEVHTIMPVSAAFPGSTVQTDSIDADGEKWAMSSWQDVSEFEDVFPGWRLHLDHILYRQAKRPRKRPK